MVEPPTYYKALWHNCGKCKIHYMSEEPHLRAYLCDECWDNTPQFVVKTPKKQVTIDSHMSDWPMVWIALYTTACMALIGIIGFYLWLK